MEPSTRSLTISTEPRRDARMNVEEVSQPDGSRFLRELFDIFINPEIERRKTSGTLPANFRLESAQVIMNVGQHRVIRLNDEVRALMKTKVRPDAKPQMGAPVYWDEIEGIEDFQLTEEDPNAGHATILRASDGWLLFFDFRYNGQRVADVLAAADEFLAMSEYAKERHHMRAFMEKRRPAFKGR